LNCFKKNLSYFFSFTLDLFFTIFYFYLLSFVIFFLFFLYTFFCKNNYYFLFFILTIFITLYLTYLYHSFCFYLYFFVIYFCNFSFFFFTIFLENYYTKTKKTWYLTIVITTLSYCFTKLKINWDPTCFFNSYDLISILLYISIDFLIHNYIFFIRCHKIS